MRRHFSRHADYLFRSLIISKVLRFILKLAKRVELQGAVKEGGRQGRWRCTHHGYDTHTHTHIYVSAVVTFTGKQSQD